MDSYGDKTSRPGNPPPPPPYPPNQEQPAQVVVTGATVIPIAIAQPMGTKPTSMVCKSCNIQIVTRVEHKTATKTHIFAGLLCLLCICCVWIPYCVDSCKNADHYCPNCNALIGSYIH